MRGKKRPSYSTPITPRQREIARHVMTGAPDKAIAQALGITPDTVRSTVSVLLHKTGKRNRTSLAVALVRAELEGDDK